MLTLVALRSSNRPVPSSVLASQLASTVSATLCSMGEAGQGSGGVAVGMPDEGASTAFRYVTLYGPTHDDATIGKRPGPTTRPACLAEPNAAEQRRSPEPKFRTRVYQSR